VAARKTWAPLATQVQDNASANKYVKHPCNYDKIIEDGTEGQPIQNCQSQRGQFQTKSSLFIQEVKLTKMGDIVRDASLGLGTKKPADEEQKMGLAVSLSLDDRIASGGSVIDAASHPDEEASWEWVNHPSEHIDQRL
jgi:hypothetical protein